MTPLCLNVDLMDVAMVTDYDRENVCRLIMVYAIFSTYAYLVNMLLASRFMRVSDQLSAFLSYAAFTIYVVACGINWCVKGRLSALVTTT